MGNPNPINRGITTHDGKNFFMYGKGSKNHKKWNKPHNPRSGKSCSVEHPNGVRRKK